MDLTDTPVREKPKTRPTPTKTPARTPVRTPAPNPRTPPGENPGEKPYSPVSPCPLGSLKIKKVIIRQAD